MSLLVLDNITKEYRNKTVLDGASLRIEKGERVALVGPNGSGKTTLLRIAAGIELCDSGGVILARGTKMGYLTQDLRDMDPDGRVFSETALYHEEVSRLEQKIRNLEAKMAQPELINNPEEYRQIVSEYARLTTRFESMDGYIIESKIKSMLLGLGLKEESLTLPLELLSGGEKTRVAFARILLDEPDLLVLDEPTNHLDIGAVEWLEGFLKRYTGGVLVVSHDRYFLDQIATRVAELGNGTITERSGNYTTFMEQKDRMREFARREQFRLKQEIRHETAIADQLKSTRKISAWKSRLKVVERLQKELDINLKDMREQHHLYHTAAPKMSFDKIKHVSREIAMANGLTKCYGSTPLFSDLSFLITGGEKVGIIGPNGCGKTTLINILLGKDQDYSGSARLGEWVRYGYLGQEISFEDEERSILDELLSVREMPEETARDYLSKFQFYGDEVDKKIEVLSGGEKVRLYLACMMLESPDCLILDEPTNHLDVSARDALEAALLEFKGTVIAISHDRYFLNRCINRILEFSDGTMKAFNGNYEAYRQIKTDARTSENAEGERKKAVNKNSGMAGKETVEKTAMEKPDIKALEGQITLLEEKRKELENSFGADTQPEEYVEYDAILKELERLYEQYVMIEASH